MITAKQVIIALTTSAQIKSLICKQRDNAILALRGAIMPRKAWLREEQH